ncbi:hypothetical protein EBZ37_10620, partial [bacterium]|nr:hypothetical protein [bacterium]
DSDIQVFETVEGLEAGLATRSSPRGLILVSSERPTRGLGMLAYPLPDLESILPSTGTLIYTVLEHLSLESFVDSFDGKRTAQIRKLIVKLGFNQIIDLIAEVAFRAGYLGEDEQANDYLERLLQAHPESGGLLQNNACDAEPFFKRVLADSNEPHGFLKAALSYYVVKVKGANLTTASRTLNISRTTLMEHLRLAQKFKVEGLFLSPNPSTDQAPLSSGIAPLN